MASDRRRRGPRPADLSPAALERAALRYLERYEASADALRRVLRGAVARAAARGGEIDVDAVHREIELVIARCRSSGLVDDRRYAETKLTSLRRRGASTFAIRSRLLASGVQASIVDGVFQEELDRSGADPEANELVAARAFAKRRRLGPHRPAGERAGRRDRDLAAMARAGFSYDIAQQALEADPPVERDEDQ
jgi:regulatory protein